MKDTSLTSGAQAAERFAYSREDLETWISGGDPAEPDRNLELVVTSLATAMAGMLAEAGYPGDSDVSDMNRLDELIRDHTADGRPRPGGFFAPPHRGPDASLEARVGALGMYLGEALRRRHGGRWRLARPGEPWPWGPVLQFPNGATTDPIQAVADRVHGGRDVSEYVAAAVTTAEGRVPDGLVVRTDDHGTDRRRN
jgi:hypothetical protein